MSYIFTDTIDSESYDAFAKKQPRTSLLQSAAWSKIKSNWGHKLVALKDEEDQIVAAALILLRPLKFGWSVWYIPRGPLMDYSQPGLVEAFFKHLIRLAKQSKCAFLKIDPPVYAHAAPYKDFADQVDPDALKLRDRLVDLGFHHQGFTHKMHDTIQPRFAAIAFNNGKKMEERASKRVRTSIRTCQRRMVEIHRGSEADLDDFCYLIAKTEVAKDVKLRDKAYFKKLLDSYGSDCYIYIAAIDLADAIAKHEQMTAEVHAKIAELPASAPRKLRQYEEQLSSYRKILESFREMQAQEGDRALLAATLSILYGRSFEILYAGFNRDFSFIPSQDPLYVRSMDEAFAAGADYVSMGGVEGNLEDGLMAYKKHYDPHVVAFLGEFDYPVNKLLYKAYQLLMKVLKLKS